MRLPTSRTSHDYRTWDAIRTADLLFSNRTIARRLFYPEDDRYLVDRDLTANHFVVAASSEGGQR